mmetsp:Transcript_43315/g.50874  ORF Transcript_43315/g.50874 Transcript_43315/m.50874 type:complete len:293 (-) Transcript_43315:73-951(-)
MVMTDEEEQKTDTIADIKSLIEVYSQSDFEYLSQKLVSLYQNILPVLNSDKDTEWYITHGQRYLKLAIQQGEGKHVVLPVFHRLLPLLEFGGHILKALELRHLLSAYLEQLCSQDEVCQAGTLSGEGYLDMYCRRLDELAAKGLPAGKEKVEFVEAAKELATAMIETREMDKQGQAYKLLQRSFELSREVYGDELNIEGSEILLLQAKIKINLKLYDECEDLIQRAKIIEEKVSSKYSDRYKKILLAESSIRNILLLNSEEQEAKESGMLAFIKSKAFLKSFGIGALAFSVL